jgi:hypothetical protein
MTHYDYRVIPAPRQLKKVKGISGAEELFAVTLTEAINEVARQGWEYVRAERLPAEAPRGWLKPAVAEEQAVLVFRRPRESLGPRLAAVRPESAGVTPAVALPPEPEAPRPVPPDERAAVNRMKSRFQRAEPSLSFEGADEDDGTPPPRLGPAEKF